MGKKMVLIIALAACLMLLGINSGFSCTSLLVTKGASTDGSVMITYTCDAEFLPHLEYLPAADYPPGDSLAIEDWKGNLHGWVKQVEHTYAVLDMINEHQLAISETTFDGRLELQNPDGLFHYWDLMWLALQRAKTAREAIKVMTDLVAEYGYRSTGETFSIADTKEAWILEMIGPDSGNIGANWVAVRIPDGYISCHANKARIGQFPLDDPANCLYSENVINFAIERGYYDPGSGKPFLFNEAYCPSTPKNKRYADTRVWSIFRRAAPSKNFPADYHRAIENTEPYPLWIKPDKKISVADVFALMRDHYEGTPYDMTRGIDAGNFGSPYRWRPLDFTIDSVEYGWERPISTQQTAFSFVSQSRGDKPDPIGGVYWYGVDDTWFTCYTPLYCGINEIPEPFTVGDLQKYSRESAWWVFNFVSNFCNLKYSYMVKDVKTLQSQLENEFLALQPMIEKTAMELYKKDPELVTKYLTDYSVSNAEMVYGKWLELGDYLITKYNDGYVKDSTGDPQGVGYPEEWLRKVINERPNQFRIPEKEKTIPESKLVD